MCSAHDIAAAYGFSPLHTGGGCMVFAKRVSGQEALYVSAEGNTIDADPSAPIWLAGRYHDDGGSLDITLLTNLDEAFVIAEQVKGLNPCDNVLVDLAVILPVKGARFVLARDVERYPNFVARAGLTGTLVEATGDLISIRLDDVLPGCEEWDNCLEWCPDCEPGAYSAFLADVALLPTDAGLSDGAS